MRNRIDISLIDRTADYLDACARIRDVNRTSLVRRLLNVIAKDKLVGEILHDEDALRKRRNGEHKHGTS